MNCKIPENLNREFSEIICDDRLDADRIINLLFALPGVKEEYYDLPEDNWGEPVILFLVDVLRQVLDDNWDKIYQEAEVEAISAVSASDKDFRYLDRRTQMFGLSFSDQLGVHVEYTDYDRIDRGLNRYGKDSIFDEFLHARTGLNYFMLCEEEICRAFEYEIERSVFFSSPSEVVDML